MTRKLAECIDGIDLRQRQVGDVFDLPLNEASLVIAEGWATADNVPRAPAGEQRAKADDVPNRRGRNHESARFNHEGVVSRHGDRDLRTRREDGPLSGSLRDSDQSRRDGRRFRDFAD